MLGLLEAVAADGTRTQRRLAAELGIALGLVNTYLKRCVNKGLVKVSEVPARRYAYYLTPKGFAEKSRLTVEYLAESFSFFRLARADCADLFQHLRSVGMSRIVLAGESDLAEISAICAMAVGVELVAVVDPESSGGTVAGAKSNVSYADVDREFDAVVVTGLVNSAALYAMACEAVGPDRVFVPKLLANTVGAAAVAVSPAGVGTTT